MYEKEVVDQEAKIEKMKAENKDEYDIKKQANCIDLQDHIIFCQLLLKYYAFMQVEVLQESKNMVPDCQRRLERAIADLKAVIVHKQWSYDSIWLLFLYHAGRLSRV